MSNVKLLAVSDFHCGLPGNCLNGLVTALSEYRAEQIILLGDVFHDNLPATTAEAQLLLGYLNAQAASGSQVIIVRGNHDWDLEQRQANGYLDYATVVDEYLAGYQDQRVAFIHGHQFDQSLSSKWWMGTLEWLEWQLRAFGGYSKLLQSFESHPQWLEVCDTVMQGAAAYARERGYDAVICGHVHQARLQLVDGIIYGNTGCAVTNRPSFICLTDTIELHEFTPQGVKVGARQIVIESKSRESVSETLAVH